MKEYKSKKEFRKELINLSPIEVYNEVLSGRYIKRFPINYWRKPEALENSKIIVKYLLEEKLKSNDIREITINDFRDNNLAGMMQMLFENSTYAAINNAYPDKYKKWEFTSRNYWNLEVAKEATKWLVEEKLKLEKQDITKITINDFKNNTLGGMMDVLFDNSIYKAIDNAYPDEYKKWEFNLHYYWNLEVAKEATKWLVEEKLKLPDNEVVNISFNDFKQNNLGGMLTILFGWSPYKAIENAYPGKYNIKDFKTRNSMNRME